MDFPASATQLAGPAPYRQELDRVLQRIDSPIKVDSPLRRLSERCELRDPSFHRPIVCNDQVKPREFPSRSRG